MESAWNDGHGERIASEIQAMTAANLHPMQQPRPTISHAEQRVYEALQSGLPDGWTAWHSLRIHDDSGAEGEGDGIRTLGIGG